LVEQVLQTLIRSESLQRELLNAKRTDMM